MILASIQRKLILMGLLIVPFISIGELYALFSGNLLSQSNNLTGVFKFSKDIIFILIILFGILDYSLKDKLSRKALLYLAFVVLVVLPPLLVSFGSEILLLASGLRWLIPVLLPFFLFGAITQELLEKISRYVFFLLFLHLLMQVFQMFFASSWFGTSAFGLNLRNPGLFLIPNTGAFFTISCLFYCLFVGQNSPGKKIFIIIISSISVFLTLSGTGLVVLLFMLFFYFANMRMLKWFVFLIPFGIIFSYFFATFLSARDANYVEQSGGTRLSIFVENFLDAHVVSTEFGLGTNTAVLLGKGEIMDSTFASLIVNLGYLGFFLVIGGLLIFIFYSILSGNKALFLFLSVFTLFSFTTIVFEVYPVNLIMAVLSVYFMSHEKKSLSPKVID